MEIGKRYKTLIHSNIQGYFTVLYKDASRMERPFLAISDDGKLEFFDGEGKSEWYVFGGSWYMLNLEMESLPKWEVIRRIYEKVDPSKNNEP